MTAHSARMKDKLNRPKLFRKVSDDIRFFRSWMGKPLTTGAVAASSPDLARLMASQIDVDLDGPVLELGPGTGAVTEALTHRVCASRLTAIEYNPDFAAHLKVRYPEINVVIGDAYSLNATLTDAKAHSFCAVISSLPLFTKPRQERERLLQQAMHYLQPGAPFIQFSYALVPPVPAQQGKWTVNKTPWVMMNLPPARVWIYRAETILEAAE